MTRISMCVALLVLHRGGWRTAFWCVCVWWGLTLRAAENTRCNLSFIMCVLWPGGRWRIKERFSAASSNCCLSSLRVALWLTKCSFTRMVLCWLFHPLPLLHAVFPVSLTHGQPAATPGLQTLIGIILTLISHHFIQNIKYVWALSPRVPTTSLPNCFSLFEAISWNCAL